MPSRKALCESECTAAAVSPTGNKADVPPPLQSTCTTCSDEESKSSLQVSPAPHPTPSHLTPIPHSKSAAWFHASQGLRPRDLFHVQLSKLVRFVQRLVVHDYLTPRLDHRLALCSNSACRLADLADGSLLTFRPHTVPPWGVVGGGQDIGPEGTMKLCEDLDVTPENVVMLIIAWKLGCRQMGSFTWEEWLHGMRQCQCDNSAKLKALLPTLVHLLEEPTVCLSPYPPPLLPPEPMFCAPTLHTLPDVAVACRIPLTPLVVLWPRHGQRLKELHRYAYDFCRSGLENPAQRSIDTETAKAMVSHSTTGLEAHQVPNGLSIWSRSVLFPCQGRVKNGTVFNQSSRLPPPPPSRTLLSSSLFLSFRSPDARGSVAGALRQALGTTRAFFIVSGQCSQGKGRQQGPVGQYFRVLSHDPARPLQLRREQRVYVTCICPLCWHRCAGLCSHCSPHPPPADTPLVVVNARLGNRAGVARRVRGVGEGAGLSRRSRRATQPPQRGCKLVLPLLLVLARVAFQKPSRRR